MRASLWWICVAALVIVLAGCSASPGADSSTGAVASRPTIAPSPSSTATAAPTATVALTSQTSFACPTTVNGSQKIFTDAQTGLSFSYPAGWTESVCQRSVWSNGTTDLNVGNLFDVYLTPRNGLTIQQWVSQQADKNETVTLAPLPVKHAQDAVTVSVTVPPSVQLDAEPYASTEAIVAGTQSFYQVIHYIALTNDFTDTVPPMSIQQVAQQIVGTFDVP